MKSQESNLYAEMKRIDSRCKSLDISSSVLLVLFISAVTWSLFEANDRITALEATIEKPELIHTCNLYDDKRRKICGWIEVE